MFSKSGAFKPSKKTLLSVDQVPCALLVFRQGRLKKEAKYFLWPNEITMPPSCLAFAGINCLRSSNLGFPC